MAIGRIAFASIPRKARVVATPRRPDYIVVGAGAAGCVVAGRLSEDPKVTVKLIEAGGSRRGLLTKIPAIAFLASVSKTRNWNFATEPVPGLNNRMLRWNQGRILGGSSSINGMIFMRGQAREYDIWRQMGCEGWSFSDVLPYFKKAETNARGSSEWHGGDGPMTIRPSRVDLPICDAFLAAVGEGGFPVVEDLHAGVSEGFGRYDTNIERGRRSSAATAYIDPALRRPNFSLVSDACATRLIIENGRVKGVEIARNGAREALYAEREVILSAGAINSAQLLMLSGIGPADHLASHGISVAHDAPEVGQNLRNHAAFRLAYTCSQPVTAYRYLEPIRGLGLLMQYGLAGTGALAESYVATGGFFRSDPALEVSDTIVVMSPALVTRGSIDSRIRDLFPHQHGFAVSVSLGRPQSTGEIRLRSDDPFAAPLIFPNYFQVESDMSALVKSVTKMRQMMRSSTIGKFIEEELEPGPSVGDDSTSIETAIRSNGGTYYHPSGSCRMGADPRAVVDPYLRVRGVDGLRVADNSIMPTALSACTHGPAIMIGERAADFILGARRGQ